MTKKDKFLKIIEFLKGLKPEQFDYSIVVSSFDKENQCGIVCDALGWFPAIFGEYSPFKWINDEDYYLEPSDNGNHILISFLEIPYSHVEALFFGDVDIQANMNLPTTYLSDNLSEVIHLFEVYYENYVLKSPNQKEIKIYDGDATAIYEETDEKKQQLWDAFILWCQEHNATTGESCQSDDFQVDAPSFMANAIDQIIKFDTIWD